MKWYKSKVYKGDQTGRKIGFPTLNLNPKVLSKNFKQGIYSSLVKISDKEYKGALYFGPRLVFNETKNALEIYVFDFDEEIYGQEVEFQIGQFIRDIKNFPSITEMKKQLEKDKEVIGNL